MSPHPRTITRSLSTLRALLLILALLIPQVISAIPAQAGTQRQEEFPPPKRPIHNSIDKVDVEVSKADDQGLSVEYAFPDPQVWWVQEGEKGKEQEYLQIAVPGMEQAYGQVGKPAIPYYSRLLALPEGASVKVAGFKIVEGKSVNGLLYPAQAEAVDGVNYQKGEDPEPDPAFEDPPFTINDDFYNGDAVYPKTPVVVELLGKMGNLNLARVSVATAKYNTSKKQTTFYRSVSFKLTFAESKGYFLTKRDLISFNRPDPAIQGLLLNGDRLFDFVSVGELRPLPCLGAQYLIITDPAFRSAADTLATAKRAAGISTSVVQTGNGANRAGTTRNAIKSYIQNRYNDDCIIQLQYLLLLGDAEHIPVWYNRTYGNDTPGSDLEYALMTSGDILPDLAIGRIPVDTLAQANMVVNKIIAYEQTPPTQASFYEDVTVAGYFQCCRPNVYQWGGIFNPVQRVDGVASRSFAETAELVGAELASEGYDLNRIYTTDDDYHDTPGRSTYYNANTRDTTPRRYYNQAPLPSAIGPNSSFSWNGNRNDVISAINDGTFLLIHRDHGFKDGWGDPAFYTWNHNFLNNGNKTPVVYSINCATGLFDNETLDPTLNGYNYSVSTTQTYWTENLLRLNGGAVAVIADTRNSPSWANSAFLRGLVDATWPGTVPEGGNTRTRRMGKILNYAKVYIMGQVGVSQTAGSVSNGTANGDVLMYHLFGDPTMKMWKQNPNQNLLVTDATISGIISGSWHVRYSQNNATITAMQAGNAIAQGTVENGIAALEFLAERQAGTPVSFIVNHDDSVAVTLSMQQISSSATKEKGGELNTPDKQLKIDIPPNVVSGETEFVLTDPLATEHALPKNHTALKSFALNAFDKTGEITQLSKPFLMDICVDTDQKKKLKSAFVAFFDEADALWVALKSDIDTKRGCVSAEVDHLTEFALLYDDSLSFGDDENTIFLPFVAQ